jgi:dCMP deaminase
MKQKFKHAFMKTAEVFAELSYAEVLKVGAVIVKDNRILSLGYNGTVTGQDNTCETKLFITEDALNTVPVGRIAHNLDGKYYYLKTKDEVLHAEMNALMKIAKSTESSDNATLITTHSPCLHCAKAIYQAGIVNVIYKHQYRDDTGIRFLEQCGITVEQLW